jgi:hypothetical protein
MLGAVERLGHSSLLISRALGGDLCSITSSFYLNQPRSNFQWWGIEFGKRSAVPRVLFIVTLETRCGHVIIMLMQPSEWLLVLVPPDTWLIDINHDKKLWNLISFFQNQHVYSIFRVKIWKNTLSASHLYIAVIFIANGSKRFSSHICCRRPALHTAGVKYFKTKLSSNWSRDDESNQRRAETKYLIIISLIQSE